MNKTYVNKQVVQIANLSVLSPGKWILDSLRKLLFDNFWNLEFKTPTFLEKNSLKWLPRGGYTGPAQHPGPSPRGLP